MQDLEQLEPWLGRSESVVDALPPRLVQAFEATFDRLWRGGPGAASPLGLHLCLGNAVVPASGLGRDGHPRREGFMPPIALPRRMWASGEMRFIAPLIVGEDVERVSTIAAIEAKHGRSGPLVFLTIEHVYRQAGEARLHETQRIVYREDPRPGEPAPPDPPAPEGTPRRTLRPDPVQLFRYSALTFNGHRIHYDQAYAREVEGYPDIVVHGPLIATLLLQACADAAPGEEIATFSFRARSPTYAGRPLELHAGRAGHRLEAFAASEGRLVMSAEASLRGEARAIA